MNPPSPFAEAALLLDADFAELMRLGNAIATLAVESDEEMDRARKLLGQFGECGDRLGTRLVTLSKTLESVRADAESIAAVVGERAQQVLARQVESERLLGEFQTLGARANELVTTIGKLPECEGAPLTDEDRQRWLKEIPRFHSLIDGLLGDARKLREATRAANMRSLERDAQALAKALVAARRRLSSVAGEGLNAGPGEGEDDSHRTIH